MRYYKNYNYLKSTNGNKLALIIIQPMKIKPRAFIIIYHYSNKNYYRQMILKIIIYRIGLMNSKIKNLMVFVKWLLELTEWNKLPLEVFQTINKYQIELVKSIQ